MQKKSHKKEKKLLLTNAGSSSSCIIWLANVHHVLMEIVWFDRCQLGWVAIYSSVGTLDQSGVIDSSYPATVEDIDEKLVVVVGIRTKIHFRYFSRYSENDKFHLIAYNHKEIFMIQ